MATLSRGQSFGVTESVTNTKLHNLVDLATITGIVDADISAGAAIQFSKLLASSIPGSILTNLDLIPIGAGYIPTANLASISNNSLLPLTLASWVSGQSFKDLASVPSGAGRIPADNLATIPGTGLYNLTSLASSAGQVPKANISNVFGSWVTSLTHNTVYQATTDIIVIAYASSTSSTIGAAYLDGLTDSSNPPTTRRAYQENTATGYYFSIIFPVKKGDYWKVNTDNMSNYNIQYIPIGS